MTSNGDPTILNLESLSDSSLEAVLHQLPLKDLVKAERISEHFGQVSNRCWSLVRDISPREQLFGNEYLRVAMKCEHLKIFDASRALKKTELISSDNETDIGVKLAQNCKGIVKFKNLGVLGVILVSNYLQNIQQNQVKSIELFPGTNNEAYTVSELKGRFIEGLRVIVSRAAVKKVVIVGSFDWSTLISQEYLLAGNLEGSTILQQMSQTVTSLRVNYDHIYRAMMVSGHQLTYLNVEFSMKDELVSSLFVNHPNLVTLKINCPRNVETFRSLESLTCLKSLTLRQITMGAITDYIEVFDSLLTARGSQLLQLALHNVYVDFHHVWTLISEKCCQLRVLNVNRYWLDQNDQDEIYRSLIRLTNLRRIQLVDFFHHPGFSTSQINDLLRTLHHLKLIHYVPKSMNESQCRKATKLMTSEVHAFQLKPEFRGRHPIIVDTEQFKSY